MHMITSSEFYVLPRVVGYHFNSTTWEEEAGKSHQVLDIIETSINLLRKTNGQQYSDLLGLMKAYICGLLRC